MAVKTEKLEKEVATTSELKQTNSQAKKKKRDFAAVIEFRKKQIDEHKEAMVVMPRTGDSLLLVRIGSQIDRLFDDSRGADMVNLPSIDTYKAKINVRSAILNLSDVVKQEAERLNKEYMESDFIELQRKELEKAKKALESL